MLIKLIPKSPQPAVLYNLCYPPAIDLPLPPAYQSILHALSTSFPQLDPPSSLHALDKATWLVAVLREVVFDLDGRGVRCVWVDGGVEEWALALGDGEGGGCIGMLEKVWRDVRLSAIEDERERLRADWERFGRARAMAVAKHQAEVQAQAQVKAKHKKQRSLLMSLVASLVPSSSSSSTPSPPPSPTSPTSHLPQHLHYLPPPPPPPPSPRPAHYLSSKQLRRRARSTLVDAWRQWVIPVLGVRISSSSSSPGWGRATTTTGAIMAGWTGGGYHPWIIRSMLRKAEAQMAWLVQENGGVVPVSVPLSVGVSVPLALALPVSEVGAGAQARYAGSAVKGPFYEDDYDDGEGEGEDGSTDTDGSSVHTPTESSLPLSTPDPNTNNNTTSKPPLPHAPPQLPIRTNTNTNPHLKPYKALTTQTHRLRQLLARHALLFSRLAEEERAQMGVLEVKSRRRAWGNGVYLLGGDKSGSGSGDLVGLGAPYRSSPLRWGCISAWDLGGGSVEEEGDMGGLVVGMESIRIPDPPSFSLSPPPQAQSSLFPVSEDEDELEDADQDQDQEGEFDDACDLQDFEQSEESGSESGHGHGYAGSISFAPGFGLGTENVEFERPQIVPRTRTQSVHHLYFHRQYDLHTMEMEIDMQVEEDEEENGEQDVTLLTPIPRVQPLLSQPPMSQSHSEGFLLNSPQRPTRNLPSQHTFPLPSLPESEAEAEAEAELFDASPPPYNADEEQRISAERRLLFKCRCSADTLRQQHDSDQASESSLSDESTVTLVSSASSEEDERNSEFTLALESLRPFRGVKSHYYHHLCPSEFGEDEWLSGAADYHR